MVYSQMYTQQRLPLALPDADKLVSKGTNRRDFCMPICSTALNQPRGIFPEPPGLSKDLLLPNYHHELHSRQLEAPHQERMDTVLPDCLYSGCGQTVPKLELLHLDSYNSYSAMGDSIITLYSTCSASACYAFRCCGAAHIHCTHAFMYGTQCTSAHTQKRSLVRKSS